MSSAAGEVDRPDGTGSDANPACGDRTTITLRVRDGVITEARARTSGCEAATAASLALAEAVTGMDAAAAARISPNDLVQRLGTLPEEDWPCVRPAVGALRAALVDARIALRR